MTRASHATRSSMRVMVSQGSRAAATRQTPHRPVKEDKKHTQARGLRQEWQDYARLRIPLEELMEGLREGVGR